VKAAGFTLLEMLTAMFMFALAVGGLALAMDKIFAANVLVRRDTEIRQQLESLLDEAMVLPIEILEAGRESEPDAMGVRYSQSAVPAELRNMDDEELPGLWWVTVRADWTEGSDQQQWEEKFLRYQP
jgi:prepilin-type N-terminal cleavage/methylation domain-containing protein